MVSEIRQQSTVESTAHEGRPAHPTLHGDIAASGGPRSCAVLVLHGGKVKSFAPARPWQLSSVRMWPFTWSLRRALGDSATVLQLQYRYRGWNGAHRSPVADARWALAQIREHHGNLPVVVVGHSMGGRTAAAIADDPNVSAVVALAPWWPSGTETTTFRPGQRLLVMHGTADSWTDPVASHAATDAAALRGVDARWIDMPRSGHFMLRRPWVWSAAVREFVVDQSKRALPTKP